MTTQPEQPPTQHVTIDQAASILGKSPATIRRMIKRGELQAIKATTPTGFVYRISLPNPAYAAGMPMQSSLAQNRRSEALEAILTAFSDRLEVLVEENARQGRRIEELATENERLRNRLAEPWWRRWFLP